MNQLNHCKQCNSKFIRKNNESSLDYLKRTTNQICPGCYDVNFKSQHTELIKFENVIRLENSICKHPHIISNFKHLKGKSGYYYVYSIQDKEEIEKLIEKKNEEILANNLTNKNGLFKLKGTIGFATNKELGTYCTLKEAENARQKLIDNGFFGHICIVSLI